VQPSKIHTLKKKTPSIHTYIFYTHLIQLGVTGVGWSPTQLSWGERQRTPWTGPHRDKQPSTLTLTTRDNLETPINLTYMFLGGGRKPENPERTQAYMGRTCKLKYFSILFSFYLCEDNKTD